VAVEAELALNALEMAPVRKAEDDEECVRAVEPLRGASRA
jgi:hypothetical protein